MLFETFFRFDSRALEVASTRKTKIERSLELEAIRQMKEAFENDIIIVELELLGEGRFGSGMVFLRYRERHGKAT
jgi:hypothetical protein